MASSGKRKTTMAKLNRERRVRERRIEKQIRKDIRKREAEHRRAQEGSDAPEAPADDARTRPSPDAGAV